MGGAGKTAAPPERRALYVYNGGFLTQRRVRRILHLAGWDLRLGLPKTGEDWVGIWGASPTASRGQAIAERRGARLLRVEDAFLRSVLPGRAGGGPGLGLLLDRRGVHFDPSAPSDLEILLQTHPLSDPSLLARAEAAMAWIADAQLSKYNAFDLDAELPEGPFVLVIDQTLGDASTRVAGGGAERFQKMLAAARAENPEAQILIKTHPETALGARQGHFAPGQLDARMSLFGGAVSPWALMRAASKVYAVSSGLGFEAILAGHRPRLFGQPFYAGWGLSDDQYTLEHRGRSLTAAQLFAAAMILYPTWYDPYRDRLCALETVIGALEAETRAWREDRQGYTATGMRLWKRRPLQQFFGQHRRVTFQSDAKAAIARAAQAKQPLLVWAGNINDPLAAAGARRVEDGFLRSRGLGADLTPPLSLVVDDLGIYYDPTCPSRMEQLIEAATALPEPRLERARRLRESLVALRLSKYNLGRSLRADLPKGHRILVPGQVEDDASIRLGAGEIRTNAALIRAAREAHPEAVILYKPHPDVEAGLRQGAVAAGEAALADLVLRESDPIALIDAVDEVWTMTSLLGFEALLRGVPVTCLGMPFYAGWGLTQDRGRAAPARRVARPSLEALVHAALIDYPRYFDPWTRRPCPVELVTERLAQGKLPRRGPGNRALAKLQGAFSSYAWLWRR